MKKIYILFILSSLFFYKKAMAQCLTPTNVPYHEGFNTITAANQLPACWAASNLGNTCLTYTSAQTLGRVPYTGTQFASFNIMPLGANYFYTNGIQLNAGVTYSTSVWYTTEYFGYTNWSDLSIMLGTSQSPTGLVSLASTNGPAVAQTYTTLSGIFVVPTSGVYYMAIRATGASTVGAQYLSFDDLAIQVVCPNSNSINLVASSTVVCSGNGPVSFTATSPNTHSWSTGATGTVTTFTAIPGFGGAVTIVGTNTLSGCSSTASINIAVISSPNVLVYASQQSVCAGQSVTLTAFGANSSTWSTGQQGSSIVVSPTVSIAYTVTGSASNGCTNSSVQAIQVYPLPVLSVSNTAPGNTICTGASGTLNAFGANSYQWSFGTNQLSGNQIIVTPPVTTTYVVVGTDANNCSAQTSYVLNVSECTGINQLSGKESEIEIFPNPFQNELCLIMGSKEIRSIEIKDLNGRTIFSANSEEEKVFINTTYYANGVYYLSISSNTNKAIYKLIKN